MPDELDAWLATLPVPEDDGAASGLIGRELPAIDLVGGDGVLRGLQGFGKQLVVFVYPATGVPGRDPSTDPAPGWDQIAGASGCTVQSLGYRDLFDRFAALGYNVVGISAQDRVEQADFVARHHMPFPMLSDPGFALANSLGLPTFTVGGKRFYKRLAMVVIDNVIAHVTYPVFPPNANAEQVLDWLERARH